MSATPETRQAGRDQRPAPATRSAPTATRDETALAASRREVPRGEPRLRPTRRASAGEGGRPKRRPESARHALDGRGECSPTARAVCRSVGRPAMRKQKLNAKSSSRARARVRTQARAGVRVASLRRREKENAKQTKLNSELRFKRERREAPERTAGTISGLFVEQ